MWSSAPRQPTSSRVLARRLAPTRRGTAAPRRVPPVTLAVARGQHYRRPHAPVSGKGGAVATVSAFRPRPGPHQDHRHPAPVASAWRSSPLRPPGASPTPGPGCRTLRGKRTPPRRPRAPGRRSERCRRRDSGRQRQAHRRRAPPRRCAPPFFQAITFTSAGTTSSSLDGWNRTPCSFLRTSPDGVRWPFMIWER